MIQLTKKTTKKNGKSTFVMILLALIWYTIISKNTSIIKKNKATQEYAKCIYNQKKKEKQLNVT